jgi:hypothetical protein
MPKVVREEDHRHPALAQLVFEGIASNETGGEALLERGHGQGKMLRCSGGR